MRLDEIDGSDEAFLHMERHVDEGAKSYSALAAKNDVASSYQPGIGAPSFELTTVIVPRERVHVVQANLPEPIVAHYVRDDGIVFVVHPDTWASADVDRLDELRAFPRGEPIRVAPTASTRTVLVLDRRDGAPPHFLKLHVPKQISRFNRRLRRKNIENSVRVTTDLAEARLDAFAYLPDELGCAFGDDDDAWGFLVRRASAQPPEKDRVLVPCFALYAGDLDRPSDPPLVVQLIERLAIDPESFLVDTIMAPIVTCWANVARHRGILLESHAQNTLIELDASHRPRRIVHRDFDVWIDVGARRRAGLDVSFRGAVLGSDAAHPVEAHYSLVYDHFLGREFFDYLLAAVSRFHRIDEDAVRARVARAFHAAFPDAARTLPANTTFYFGPPTEGGSFRVVDTREPPRWR